MRTHLLKTLWRKFASQSLREAAAAACYWGRLWANYALMRSTFVSWVRRVGAWPRSLILEGTNICNARCAFCAYPQMKRPKTVMSLKVFRDAVDQYLSLGYGEINLTPIAGEPLLDPRLFERLDDLSSRPEVRQFYFYTNLIALNERSTDRLTNYDARFSMLCSLGGLDRPAYRSVMGVDKFEEVAANIRRLLDAKKLKKSRVGVQINLRVSASRMNGPFWDYLRRMRDDGLMRLEAMDRFDNWGGKIAQEQVREAGLIPQTLAPRQGPCRLLFTGPFILADGRVNACACRDLEASLIVGDLKAESLRDILRGPKLEQLVIQHERGRFPDVCRTCTYYQSIYFPVKHKLLRRALRLLIGGFPR